MQNRNHLYRWLSFIAVVTLGFHAFGQHEVLRFESRVPPFQPGSVGYQPAGGGIITDGWISGISAGDVNNDGQIDLFVPQKEGVADLLLINDNGFFQDKAMGWQLPASGPNKLRSRASLFVDFDGDGRLDLFVLGDARAGSGTVFSPDVTKLSLKPRLYRQLANGTFVDVSIDSLPGIQFYGDIGESTRHLRQAGSVAAADLNGDGYPELVIGMHQFGAVPLGSGGILGIRLLLNTPGATPGTRMFVDVSSAVLNDPLVTLGSGAGAETNSFWQILLHDFDGDGLLDIFGAVDDGPNRLYLNNGSQPVPGMPGVFALNQMSEHGTSAPIQSDDTPTSTDMGATLGDINNDARFDVFVTQSETASGGWNSMHVRNLPVDRDFIEEAQKAAFVDRAVDLGLTANGPSTTTFGWGWGCTLADLDRNRWLDLATTGTGMAPAGKAFPRIMLARYNAMTQNLDFEQFDSAETDDFSVMTRGSTMIAADFDGDGALDLIETALDHNKDGVANGPILRYLRNTPDCGPATEQLECPRWLVVRPRMDGGNSQALGAIVRVELGQGATTTVMTRQISAGTSMAGQEPAEAFFGLGSDVVGSDKLWIHVIWPDGRPDTILGGLASNFWDQVIHLGPCTPLDLSEPFGVLDAFDIAAYQNLFDAGDAKADLVAPFGVLDAFDFNKAIGLIQAGCP